MYISYLNISMFNIMLCKCYYVLNTYCDMKGNISVKHLQIDIVSRFCLPYLREVFLENFVRVLLGVLRLLCPHLPLDKSG